MSARRLCSILGFLSVNLLCSSAMGAPWYVDDSHTSGTRDGTTWATAFQYLQDALDASASGDTIKIAQGVYHPDDDGGFNLPAHTANSRTEYFKPKAAVEVYGGYIGYDSVTPSPDTRDPTLYVTILSGDLSDNDTFVPGSPPTFTNYGENSNHVVDLSDSSQFTRIDGCTITHGNANVGAQAEVPTNHGGGIYVSRVTPATGAAQVVQCIISENRANQTGGGVRILTIESPGLSITDSTITNNYSGSDGAGIRNASIASLTNTTLSNNYTPTSGGGMYSNGGPLTLVGCRVTGNRAARGAGIRRGSGDVTIRSSTIDDNHASISGGGMHWGGGASVRLVVVNSFLIGNDASGANSSAGGGGLFVGELSDAVEIVNTQFLGNKSLGGSVGGAIYASAIKEFRITNCVFSKNSSANTNGGAIFATSILDDGLGYTELTNCTLVANDSTGAGLGGGVHYEEAANVIIKNCILWKNHDTNWQISSSQIHAGSNAGTISVDHSDIMGGFTGTGNINADPKFVNEPGENYHLVYCSPTIDIGDDSALTDAQDPGDLDGDSDEGEPTPLDLELQARIIDNAYVATFSAVDMGAYENISSVACGTLEGDVSGDSAVNGLDIQEFVDCLMLTPTACPCADMSGDGFIKTDDIPCFITKVLTPEATCVSCASLRGVPDCNANGEDDANDIAWGNSQDCNQNGVPDECDINTEDPDGNELISDDENTNGIPDECEADCNTNGHPDDVDVAGQTSNDMNSNGVPDECEADCNTNGVPDDWDISEATSADCNLDGIPDECQVQFECNGNGVPDDCDMNPEDPDGDEWVSPDCNSNNYPDECDLTMSPPFGSIDCNENGVPDECDIASEASADENENGIPDECEEGQRSAPAGGPLSAQLDGSSLSEPSPQPSPLEGEGEPSEAGRSAPTATEAERWASFYDWCVTANFAGLSQRERYDAIMAELDERDLPRAWRPVPTAQ